MNDEDIKSIQVNDDVFKYGEFIQIIKNQNQFALFLLCREAHRVLSLSQKYKGYMVDVFSKFRTRNHFDEYLKTRFNGDDLELISRLDPEIVTGLLFIFDHIHELRMSLKYTSALPNSVENEITYSLSKAIHVWNALTVDIKNKMQWDFPTISS